VLRLAFSTAAFRFRGRSFASHSLALFHSIETISYACPPF